MRQKITKIIFLIGVSILFAHCASPSIKDEEKGNKDNVQCCVKESSTEKSETSEITCPKCGFKKREVVPTEVCQIKYTCSNCRTELTPLDGDCCVYCTYGTHKCPSMQEEKK